MNDKDKKQIWDKILKIIPNPECPMCHNRKFAIMDSYFLNPVIEDYHHASVFMRKSVPAASIICTNCGFISQHALGILGLLDKNENLMKEEEIGK